MEIRAGCLRDLAQVREIWHHCFGNDAFCEWFFSRLYDPANLRVLVLDKTIVSMAFCFPREIQSQIGIVKAWYLYGIGTHPAARGKGYARSLIEACVSEAKTQGIDLCFLIPAEQSLFSYYERLGFSQVWSRTVCSQSACAVDMQLGTRAVSSDDIALLDRIYKIAFPSRVCRSEADWSLILEEFRVSQGDAHLLYENGRLLGYAFIFESDGILYIRELGLCEEVKRIDVCHALCKGCCFELTQDGTETRFAMAYPLSKRGMISENVYCDLLYN